MWLLSVYNSYKYARTIPISIACYWLLPLKCLARTLFFVLFYRLSIVKYRILIIDRANHHSTVNCHKLVLFSFYRYFYYLYAIIFFFFLICSLQMRVMKIHLLCIDVIILPAFCSSICLVIQLH